MIPFHPQSFKAASSTSGSHLTGCSLYSSYGNWSLKKGRPAPRISQRGCEVAYYYAFITPNNRVLLLSTLDPEPYQISTPHGATFSYCDHETRWRYFIRCAGIRNLEHNIIRLNIREKPKQRRTLILESSSIIYLRIQFGIAILQ